MDDSTWLVTRNDAALPIRRALFARSTVAVQIAAADRRRAHGDNDLTRSGDRIRKGGNPHLTVAWKEKPLHAVRAPPGSGEQLAARHIDLDADRVTCSFRGKKNKPAGYIFRLTDTADRRIVAQPLQSARLVEPP